MSNVVSPRGPLPPRVYWRRRLVLCVVVVGLVLLVGRLFGGGDDTEPVADRGAQAPAPSATPTATPTKGTATQAGPRAATEPTLSRRQVARRAAARARAAELSGATGPLASASGPCAPSDVAVVPDVRDAHASSAVPLRLGLSATGDRACTFAFGADSVALRVTSGDDLIWDTQHCASALPAESVVVRPGWLSYVSVDWSGQRAGEGCDDGGGYADPGYYWAEAAAIGGEPARSQFELTEPPPKPTPTATPTAGPTAGATPSADDEAGPTAGPSSSAADDSQPSDSARDGSGSGRPSASETAEPSPGRGDGKPADTRRSGG